MTKKLKKATAEIKKKNYYLIVILPLFILIGFLIYSNTFSTPFVLDDFRLIVDNSSLHNNSIYSKFNLPRYVGYVSFGLNYIFNRFDPAGYHLINIIIHIFNAILIVILFRKLFDTLPIKNDLPCYHYLPAIAALLFLVHPIQTQSVTYIVQRLASLAAMFALVSLICYVLFKNSNSSRYRYYFFSLLAALLAFKTKENTATLPLMLIAIEWFFYKKQEITLRKRIAHLIPFFILIAVIPLSMTSFDAISGKSATDIMKSSYATMSEIVRELSETTYQTQEISRSQYLITQFRVIATYIKMLFLPINQSLYHVFPLSHSLFEIKTLLSFLLLIGIIAAVSTVSHKYTEISFGIAWFFIFLIVESSIFPIYDVIFEHRLYLPSVGFIIAFVYLVYYLVGKRNFKIMLTVIIMITIVLSALTYKRNSVWKNELSIWQDVIKKYPESYLAHGALGTAYAKAGDCDAAIKELQITLDLLPTYMKAYNNLATCYIKKDMTQKAIEAYKAAIKIVPDYVLGFYNLASLYYQNGRIKEALLYLHKAHELDETHAMVNAQLGSIYCNSGYLDDSIAYYEQAVDTEPHNADIYYNYGICYLSHGNNKEARNKFMKALELNPEDIDNYFFIAVSYDNEMNYEKARNYYSLYLSKSPSNAPLAERARLRLK